jgi:hypothetical protein
VGFGECFGLRRLRYPGNRPVLVAGPLVAWIIGALEGAVVVGGLTAIGAGLISIGIPKVSVLKYESALKADKFIVVAQGAAAEVAKARDIMQSSRPAECALHGPEPGALAPLSA